MSTIQADQPSPPRICLVLSQFHPRASGAERQALTQARELVARGHEVRVVTRFLDGSAVDDEIDGVRVHRWVRTSSRGPMFGVSFVAGVVRALRRLRDRYDLIHTHQGLWEAISSGAARPWLRGAPTLIQPASSGFYGEAEELARTRGFPILRRLALHNTAFAAISADIERQWLSLGVPPSKMVRMASGVDADHFRPGPPVDAVERSMPPRPAPRALFTGRLHPQKNLDLLLDAWPAVVSASGAHLILLGDGPDRARIVDRSTALGIDRFVHLPGPADPADYLRAVDAFVLPSVAEGMSNSLLEAMSTGLPCLATDIGGNSDLLLPGEVGRLLPSDVPGAWSDALVETFAHPDRARQMGLRARRRIETDFALGIVVDRYQELYRKLVGGSFPHSG